MHSESNSIARLQNSLLISPDSALTELHNPETNLPIDRFPATPGEIYQMTNAALNSVLRALGVGVGGTMEARRQRLRLKIGLKADPV
jgi:predicted NBD/HSP70 family sugar kinase